MKQVLIGLIIIAVIGTGLAIASNMNKGNSPAPGTASDQSAMGSSSVSSVSPATEDVQTIDVEAGSFYYKPNEIMVKKGQKVKIVITAVSMMHDFNIDELDVKMPIVQNGSTGTVEFTPDKTGEFEYYCSVGQHRANGQVGKIIVQ